MIAFVHPNTCSHVNATFFKNERVAVIGSGSSSFNSLPHNSLASIQLFMILTIAIKIRIAANLKYMSQAPCKSTGNANSQLPNTNTNSSGVFDLNLDTLKKPAGGGSNGGNIPRKT
jgi:alkyl hydroperoxide reductase subunit AhpF